MTAADRMNGFERVFLHSAKTGVGARSARRGDCPGSYRTAVSEWRGPASRRRTLRASTTNWSGRSAHPIRVNILEALQGRVASPSELSKEMDESLGVVSYHTNTLVECGCLATWPTQSPAAAPSSTSSASRRVPLSATRTGDRLPSHCGAGSPPPPSRPSSTRRQRRSRPARSTPTTTPR